MDVNSNSGARLKLLDKGYTIESFFELMLQECKVLSQ